QRIRVPRRVRRARLDDVRTVGERRGVEREVVSGIERRVDVVGLNIRPRRSVRRSALVRAVDVDMYRADGGLVERPAGHVDRPADVLVVRRNVLEAVWTEEVRRSKYTVQRVDARAYGREVAGEDVVVAFPDQVRADLHEDERGEVIRAAAELAGRARELD